MRTRRRPIRYVATREPIEQPPEERLEYGDFAGAAGRIRSAYDALVQVGIPSPSDLYVLRVLNLAEDSAEERRWRKWDAGAAARAKSKRRRR